MLIDFTRSNKEGMNIWAGYGKELINIHISSTELAAVMKNVVTGNFEGYAFHLFAKAHADDKSSDLTWEVGVSYRPISILFEDWDLYDRGHPAEEVLFRVKLVNALLGLTKRISIEDKGRKGNQTLRCDRQSPWNFGGTSCFPQRKVQEVVCTLVRWRGRYVASCSVDNP